MCLILFALNAHPKYQLILAANRDEFYARPTEKAGFWQDAPQILAGRDTVYGGTWLGITKRGRFSAVTNFRDPSAPAGTKSRGDLTSSFLRGDEPASEYLKQIKPHEFSGFNLLAGDFSKDKSELFYLSNRAPNIINLSAGIYGLSNALLDTNWHKVETGKAAFAKIVENSDEINPHELFEILADRRIASDEKLPATGIGIERERILSPAFIETENYGTRISTVLLIGRDGRVHFVEKTFVGAVGEVECEFHIENLLPAESSPRRQ